MQSNPENPIRFTGIKLTKVPQTAAGIPAVTSALKHVFGAMDMVRGWKALLALNQKSGYDCPGCAWPDPDDERSAIAEYCENGAKAIAEEATTRRLTPSFFEKHSIATLADGTDYEIGKHGRIAQPMYLPAGAKHYQPISWKDAFELIAQHLNNLASPDEAIFYTSGRTSNEAAFLYQLFVRTFGTNNLPDCSNMCHESSGVALTESLGIGKGSVTLDDFNHAEVILIIGQNPGTNHPRMLTALQEAKARGAKIVSINPLPEAGLMGFNNPQRVKGVLGLGSHLSDLFLQVRINGDMALIQAIIHLWLRWEQEEPGSVLDNAFIETRTTGFNTFKNHISKQDLNQLVEASGVSLDQIVAAAALMRNKTKIIACWAMGLTQHKNAVDTIREVVNLLLLKGCIGKPGAGTCPVRGHSNVQGDRTMGIYEKPSQAFLDRLGAYFQFVPPQKWGLDTVEAIEAMHAGKAKVFFAMGGNFLSATPDTLFTAEALRRCSLTVQVSTKLNRSHLIPGKEAIILPTYGRSDIDKTGGITQFVSCENSMGVVQKSQGNLPPVSDELLSEVEIVCRLAMATVGKVGNIDWGKYTRHYDYIRDDIAKVIPGFEQYNVRVRQPGGFYLPNSARKALFNTPDERAAFNIGVVVPIELEPGELLMMTIRSHDQFNTTIYGLDDRYRGVLNERRVIFMNKLDIMDYGFSPGDVVDLYNECYGVCRIAKKFIIIAYSIPRGCAATYFPETNVLVPIQNTAEKSNTPMSKAVPIRIRAAQ